MKTSRMTGNRSADSSMIQPLEARRLMSLTSGIDLPTAPLPPTAVQPSAIQPSAVQPSAVQPSAVQPSAIQPSAIQIVQINHAIAAAANPQAVVQQFMATQTISDSTVSGFPAPPPFDLIANPPSVDPAAAANFAANNDALESQLAQAIAHGAPLIIYPTAVADEQRSAAEETRPTTLSALYGTIGTSTVSAIDNATTAPSIPRSSASGDLPDDLPLSQAITDSAKSPALPTIAATSPTNAQNSAAGILLSSLATSVPGTSSTGFEVNLLDERRSADNRPQWPGEIVAAETASVLSRNILESLEQELLAAKVYSQELVWNMGRDRAIELSHAETAEDLSQEKSSDWKTTAAVIGAAVASIVYAEKELVRGKKNVGPIFSVRPLHDDASSPAYAG